MQELEVCHIVVFVGVQKWNMIRELHVKNDQSDHKWIAHN